MLMYTTSLLNGTEPCEHKFKIQSEHKKMFFYCKGGQVLAQVVQRSCGVSIHGDNQNPTGRGPRQLALGGPALDWTV